MRNTGFAKVRWRRGSGQCGRAVASTIQASEPTSGSAEGSRRIQGHTDLVRIKQPKSEERISRTPLRKVLFRFSPMSGCLSSTKEIADGAHRLLVKNAQSRKPGESALHMGGVPQSLALGIWRSNWDGRCSSGLERQK